MSKPLLSSQNSKCLLNGSWVELFGSAVYHLRGYQARKVSVALTAVANKTTSAGGSNIGAVKAAAIASCKTGVWGFLLHEMALALVIRQPIYSLYPVKIFIQGLYSFELLKFHDFFHDLWKYSKTLALKTFFVLEYFLTLNSSRHKLRCPPKCMSIALITRLYFTLSLPCHLQ